MSRICYRNKRPGYIAFLSIAVLILCSYAYSLYLPFSNYRHQYVIGVQKIFKMPDFSLRQFALAGLGTNNNDNAPSLSPKSTGTVSDEQIDEALYDMFMKQLSREISIGKEVLLDEEDDQSNTNSRNERSVILPKNKLVENPTILTNNTAVEILHNKCLLFGNFVGKKSPLDSSSSAVIVRLSSGAEVTIDAAQIVSVWDSLAPSRMLAQRPRILSSVNKEHEKVFNAYSGETDNRVDHAGCAACGNDNVDDEHGADEDSTPLDPVGWACVTTEAMAILRNLSPRKSDLKDFWQLVSKKRSLSVPVDSLDLGVYIFQESKFKAWIDPYADASVARVRALTAPQRYAAALLLHNDNIHFKRRNSRLLSIEAESDETDRVNDSVNISIGASGLSVASGWSSRVNTSTSDSDRENAWGSTDPLDTLVEESCSAGPPMGGGLVTAAEVSTSEPDTGSVCVVEGGYKLLEGSISAFKECELFAEYYKEQQEQQEQERQQEQTTSSSTEEPAGAGPIQTRRKASLAAGAFRSACVTRQLRMLEFYAVSGPSVRISIPFGSGRGNPSSNTGSDRGRSGGDDDDDSGSGSGSGDNTAPKAVKMLLKRLNLPVSKEGARRALLNVGHHSSFSHDSSRGSNGGRSSMGPDSDVLVGKFQPVISSSRKQSAGTKLSQPPSSSSSAPSSYSGYAINITPWSPEVLKEAQELRRECINRRQIITAAPLPSKPGKMGPLGRMDYRGVARTHPPICIDTKFASFYDDAFSLSPDTGELLVHVVDIIQALRKFDALQEAAQDRISSMFLPQGPLHMLPPQALDALKLSTAGPNEVITVALSIEFNTGKVLAYRVFPSIIGPVVAMDMQTVNDVVGGGDAATAAAAVIASVGHKYPDAVINDLITAHELLGAVSRQEPWIQRGRKYSSSSSSSYFSADEVEDGTEQMQIEQQFHSSSQRAAETAAATLGALRVEKRTGMPQRREVATSVISHQMVNAMLTLYSNASHHFCTEKGVAVPLAWENRDKIVTSRARRFGTQPLRNWIAQLQQRQVRAAMKMELPMTTKACAMAVTHYNRRRRQQAKLLGSTMSHGQHQRLVFEAFENHCAVLIANQQEELGHNQHQDQEQLTTDNVEGADPDADMKIKGDMGAPLRPRVIVKAEGTGRGGMVKILNFDLHGVVNENIPAGETVQVEVEKIVPQTRTVQLRVLRK